MKNEGIPQDSAISLTSTGLDQSSSTPEPEEPSSPSNSPQSTASSDLSDPCGMIPEQDLAPLRARVKEYITRHTRQYHQIYHPHSSSSSSATGGAMQQTVYMLKRAQRINSDLWFVQRSLTDEKGVTKTQLHKELLPKLEECMKELDSLGGLRREVSMRVRKAVEMEAERIEGKGQRGEGTRREQSPMKRGRKMVSEVSMLMRNFVPFGFGFGRQLRGRF